MQEVSIEDGNEADVESSSQEDRQFIYRHRTISLERHLSFATDSSRERDVIETPDGAVHWLDLAATLRNNANEDVVDNFVTKIEQHVHSASHLQQADQLRRQALRDMPQSLTMKRLVKQKLHDKLSQNPNKDGLNYYTKVLYNVSIFGRKSKAELHSLMYTFQLWYSILKRIEGQFGSAVATFFRFYRWLFLVNVFTAIISFLFVILPQILESSDNGNNPEDFAVLDIFTGEGYFTNTILFYGFYTNATISPISGLQYNMPHAYFFTIFILYFVNLVILSISMGGSYKKNFIETKGGLKNIFVHKVFAGWDFSIADKRAADLKSSALYFELKEYLQEEINKSVDRTCLQKFITYSCQVLANIIVIVFLGGLGYGLWLLLENDSFNIGKEGAATYNGIITAIIVNSLIYVASFAFNYIVRIEDYKNPRITFNIKLMRMFLLEMVVVAILLAYWILYSDIDCWETNLGQEIYRLVIFDFLFSIIFLVPADISIYYISRKYKKLGSTEFNTARYTLQLTYNQTLFWVGLYFSPMLSVIVIIKLFLFWYITSIVITKFCKPPNKSWRAAQTQTYLLIVTFLSLLLVIAVLGYVIYSKPSSTCGPFRHLKYVFDIIKIGILNMRNGSMIWVILMFFTKPGAIAIILLSMCMAVYYLRAKAQAQEGMVKVLRNMLQSEAKDKEFLLRQINGGTRQGLNNRNNKMDSYYENQSYYGGDQYGDSNAGECCSDLLLPYMPSVDNAYQSSSDSWKKIV